MLPKPGHLIEIVWKSHAGIDEWSFGVVVAPEHCMLTASDEGYHRVEGSFLQSTNKQYAFLTESKEVIDHGFACKEIWEELGF